jgi:hypothetical protein
MWSGLPRPVQSEWLRAGNRTREDRDGVVPVVERTEESPIARRGVQWVRRVHRIQQPAVDHETLKQALKEAMVEALRENRELVREVLVESLEDAALAEAIRQALESEPVDRDEVMAILKEPV